MNKIAWAKLSWLVIATFALAQMGLIFFLANGPYVDEGITIIAGYRIFEGNVFVDRYVEYFAGSPFLWPVFAALGHMAGGLEGARLMALGFIIWTLIMFAHAVTYLFDEQVAFWSTLLLGLNGLYIALAHFAVYDVPAFAGISTSLFLLTKFFATEQRRWLIGSAIFFLRSVCFQSIPMGS